MRSMAPAHSSGHRWLNLPSGKDIADLYIQLDLTAKGWKIFRSIDAARDIVAVNGGQFHQMRMRTGRLTHGGHVQFMLSPGWVQDYAVFVMPGESVYYFGPDGVTQIPGLDNPSYRGPVLVPSSRIAICKQCGREFTRATTWQVYCSTRCRAKHWRLTQPVPT